jgi:hypothetical protein
MPATGLLDLADEMGFLVMDEAFDMWESSKTEFDYGRFFREWNERDVRSWIRRDRNHPSIMLWSIGNEIYDTHASPHAPEIAARLKARVEAFDPDFNARVTIGSCPSCRAVFDRITSGNYINARVTTGRCPSGRAVNARTNFGCLIFRNIPHLRGIQHGGLYVKHVGDPL